MKSLIIGQQNPKLRPHINLTRTSLFSLLNSKSIAKYSFLSFAVELESFLQATAEVVLAAAAVVVPAAVSEVQAATAVALAAALVVLAISSAGTYPGPVLPVIWTGI